MLFEYFCFPELQKVMKTTAFWILLLAGASTSNENQRFFKLTGGSHAAAAFDTAGQLLILREDVGRHNAVDKVVGGMLNSSIDSAKFLLVSGRVSYEIITKVFRAKIPVLIAVSAPSSLSIDYAKELGIRLYAFCRDGKSTRYS